MIRLWDFCKNVRRKERRGGGQKWSEVVWPIRVEERHEMGGGVEEVKGGRG